MTELIYIILAALACINIFAAGAVIFDKFLSKKPRGSVRRIPEKTFVRFSVFGGGFGTLFAMFMIRHKTKSHNFLLLKIAFFTILWAAAILVALKYF